MPTEVIETRIGWETLDWPSEQLSPVSIIHGPSQKRTVPDHPGSVTDRLEEIREAAKAGNSSNWRFYLLVLIKQVPRGEMRQMFFLPV